MAHHKPCSEVLLRRSGYKHNQFSSMDNIRQRCNQIWQVQGHSSQDKGLNLKKNNQTLDSLFSLLLIKTYLSDSIKCKMKIYKK